MANGLSREQLQRLARLGAHARLAELEAERQAILRAFPGLAGQASPGAPGGTPSGEGGPAAAAGPRARRRKRTAAQRKAQSERMKKIWLERRKQQG